MSAGHSPNARQTVFERDKWTCRSCGFHQTNEQRLAAVERLHEHGVRFERWLTIDHIVPRAKGGNERMENLQTLCNVCNGEKANRCDPAERIPVRPKKEFRKTGHKRFPHFGHHPFCDEEFCFHLCRVYQATEGLRTRAFARPEAAT